MLSYVPNEEESRHAGAELIALAEAIVTGKVRTISARTTMRAVSAGAAAAYGSGAEKIWPLPTVNGVALPISDPDALYQAMDPVHEGAGEPEGATAVLTTFT